MVQFVDTFALDAKTGEIRWQTKHPHIWGTSAPLHLGQSTYLLTDCGEILNPADGTTLAKTGMALEYGSPLVRGDIAYCASGNTARAFQFAAGADGTITVTKLGDPRPQRPLLRLAPALR